MPRRLRPRKPWRIRGKNAPSPRGYISLVRRWWRDYSAWALGVLDELAGVRTDNLDDAGTEQLTLELKNRSKQSPSEGGPPAPPSAGAISRAGLPAARQAAKVQRKVLRDAGAQLELLVSNLKIATNEDGELVGVDLILGGVEQVTLDDWAREGAKLVRRVPVDQEIKLLQEVSDAVAQGGTWRELRAVLEQRLDIGKRNLELIARDQVAKLNGKITQAMQTAAGVDEYTWRANRDARVRDSHADADGNVYSWASDGAPGVGFYGEAAHPGQAGQCRCTAEPLAPTAWAS